MANYIKNRCVTKILGIKTPYELWFGKRPYVGHMQKFGAKAYMLDKSPNKGKFSPRGIEGILTGYSDTAKAYRIWTISEKKMHVTRDVKFVQNLSPRTVDIGIDAPVLPKADDPPPLDVQDESPEIRVETREDSTSDEQESETRRGPGRPRKLKTGKPGRLSKQYSMVPTIQIRPDEDRGGGNEAEEVAEFAFSVGEIPFDEAISGSDKEEWLDAVYSEMRCLISNDVFDIVTRPEDKKVVNCRTILRNKYNERGDLNRRKARLVAKGFSQRPGVDFFDTFAPVARLGSFRLVALAAKYDLGISQLDIETAYLNGDIDTDIYMKIPELLHEMLQRMIRQEKNCDISKKAHAMLEKLKERNPVCRLRKALYGLRQADRLWHAKLDEALRSIGLTPTESDPCVYVDIGKPTFVLIYVDDILIVSSDRRKEAHIKEKLSRVFKVKDMEPAKYCLGLEIRRDNDKISLSQKGYINEILRRFGMQDCHPISTPIAYGSKLTREPDVRDDGEPSYPYQELVGALMYAAMGTCPDIAHAVSVLSQFNSCYGKQHWVAAKQVLRYLQGTADCTLSYSKNDSPLRGYIDADWGSCTIDRRSYTGYTFIFCGAAVTWESRKQRTVALLSTEAEYMAIGDAVKEAMYLASFLGELGHPILSGVVLFNDNHGAHFLAENPSFSTRTKHIDIRHHFIRKVFQEKKVRLSFLSTEEMIADVLTKALPTVSYVKCCAGLGLHSVQDFRAQIDGDC